LAAARPTGAPLLFSLRLRPSLSVDVSVYVILAVCFFRAPSHSISAAAAINSHHFGVATTAILTAISRLYRSFGTSSHCRCRAAKQPLGSLSEFLPPSVAGLYLFSVGRAKKSPRCSAATFQKDKQRRQVNVVAGWSV